MDNERGRGRKMGMREERRGNGGKGVEGGKVDEETNKDK